MGTVSKIVQFDGYLFSKLAAIGTKSEGPIYLLQQPDYSELPIQKHTQPWSEDPALHRLLGKKVTVHGARIGDSISYETAAER